MRDKLERRLREYELSEPSDLPFVERLLELTEKIGRGFDGKTRQQLLDLAEDTFERHLELREHTQRARKSLERLRADQQRLVRILERLTTRPKGEPLH